MNDDNHVLIEYELKWEYRDNVIQSVKLIFKKYMSF
jgi:hypothetical protein